MAAPAIDFWFTMGSTYTFLTVGRIDAVARAAGVTVRMRPFRSVPALTGAMQLPFLPGTAKLDYMWRDIGRRAALHGLRASLPAPYPAPSPPRANRVAVVGMAEGWGPDYVRAAYRLWFEQGIGSGGEENLRLALAECGQAADTERILALAESEAVVEELDRATEAARRLGLFGSPSFVVGRTSSGATTTSRKRSAGPGRDASDAGGPAPSRHPVRRRDRHRAVLEQHRLDLQQPVLAARPDRLPAAIRLRHQQRLRPQPRQDRGVPAGAAGQHVVRRRDTYRAGPPASVSLPAPPARPLSAALPISTSSPAPPIAPSIVTPQAIQRLSRPS